MLPMQHAISIAVCGVAWIGAGVIVVWTMYYQAQATNNLKPDSPWAGRFRWGNRRAPRSEFTERGLWYRRRYYIMLFIFVAWVFLVVFPAYIWAGGN
jgi:hypothetical protein